MEEDAAKKPGSLELRELFAECIRGREEEGKVEALKVLFQESDGSEGDKKSILEQAFRDVLGGIVSPPDGELEVARCTGLVLLAISAAQDGVCHYTLPFIILSDVLECLTLDMCEMVFEFVEDRVSTWIRPEFYSSGKILLLRMSNDLLRRLSSAQNTIFCGRIQLFLARLFPLSEKSALNLMSHFNLDNVTTYNKEAGQGVAMEEAPGGEDEGEVMEVDDEESDDSSLPVDYNLYHKLWALQDFFCQPTHCYTSEKWKILTVNVEEVLRTFSSFKLEDVQAPRRKNKKPATLVEYSESHYFAKFLTSEKLMNLQLRDSHFRRHVLLQLLVLFHYLLGDVKFKASSHSLQESQTAWVKEVTENVYKLLEETPPQGAEFAGYIRHILKREEHWVAWKNDGCPSYEKPSLAALPDSSSSPPYPPTEHLGDVHARSGRQRHDLGNSELTRLWNLCPDNLEACRKKNRNFVPDLQKFIAEPVEQADPAARIEPEYKVINNPNFSWQALRLLSQSSTHFFQNTTAQIKSLPEYLEHVAVQTSKDLASQ